MSNVMITGAYGRRYWSEAEARSDWNMGYDFYSLTDRCYCSKRDFAPGGECAIDEAIFVQRDDKADLYFILPKV